MLCCQYFFYLSGVHMNLNTLLCWTQLFLTVSSCMKLIDAIVLFVDAVPLNDRKPSPSKSICTSKEFSLKGCKITGTCAFRVHTKHDQTLLTVSSHPAKSSSSLCRHKLIRSAEICKQRTVSNALVCNPPT